MRIIIDAHKCIGDGVCVSFCPFDVLQLKELESGDKVAEAVRPEECTACYTCQGQCSQNAIFVEQV